MKKIFKEPITGYKWLDNQAARKIYSAASEAGSLLEDIKAAVETDQLSDLNMDYANAAEEFVTEVMNLGEAIKGHTDEVGADRLTLEVREYVEELMNELGSFIPPTTSKANRSVFSILKLLMTNLDTYTEEPELDGVQRPIWYDIYIPKRIKDKPSMEKDIRDAKAKRRALLVKDIMEKGNANELALVPLEGKGIDAIVSRVVGGMKGQ